MATTIAEDTANDELLARMLYEEMNGPDAAEELVVAPAADAHLQTDSDGLAATASFTSNSRESAAVFNELYGHQLHVFVRPGDDYEAGDPLEILDMDQWGFSLQVGYGLLRHYAWEEQVVDEEQLQMEWDALVEAEQQERDYDRLQQAERKYMNDTLAARNPRVVVGKDKLTRKAKKKKKKSGSGSSSGHASGEGSPDASGGPAEARVRTGRKRRGEKQASRTAAAAQHREQRKEALFLTVRSGDNHRLEKFVTFDVPPKSMALLLKRINQKFALKGKRKFTRLVSRQTGETGVEDIVIESVGDLETRGVYIACRDAKKKKNK